MATIKDIAQMSGYSIGTVSRVLNNRADVSDKARETIERVIKDCNYQPNANAKMLKQNVSSEVSVIVRGNRITLFSIILEEIQYRMMEHGETINVQFIPETENEVTTAVQVVQNLKPKGIVFLGGNSINFREEFGQIALPCVLVTVCAEELGFDNLSSFTIDDEEAAGCVIRQLLAKGHRRIGIVGGYPKDGSEERRNDGISLRIDSAVEELEKNDIAFDYSRDYVACDYSAEDGYDAARRLLTQSPDLTAIFAITDAIGLGALRALKDMNLNVPEDISVVGFNGVNYGKFSIPRLATIRQDISLLARKSVDDLLMRISYQGPAAHEKIPYEFVDGESIAPPRK